MSDILPLFPAVPIVPKIGHSDIKANTESEGSGEDGGHVDTVALDECVIKGGGKRHGRMNELTAERRVVVSPGAIGV